MVDPDTQRYGIKGSNSEPRTQISWHKWMAQAGWHERARGVTSAVTSPFASRTDDSSTGCRCNNRRDYPAAERKQHGDDADCENQQKHDGRVGDLHGSCRLEWFRFEGCVRNRGRRALGMVAKDI
jgi:hypothetical protein